MWSWQMDKRAESRCQSSVMEIKLNLSCWSFIFNSSSFLCFLWPSCFSQKACHNNPKKKKKLFSFPDSSLAPTPPSLSMSLSFCLFLHSKEHLQRQSDKFLILHQCLLPLESSLLIIRPAHRRAIVISSLHSLLIIVFLTGTSDTVLPWSTQINTLGESRVVFTLNFTLVLSCAGSLLFYCFQKQRLFPRYICINSFAPNEFARSLKQTT